MRLSDASHRREVGLHFIKGSRNDGPTGSHTLLCAPTGSGKTLAAFLWSIDRLGDAAPPPPAERCRVLYVSPLRALTVDVERNLRAPLRGIALEAERRIG